MDTVIAAGAALAAYLLGSIPFAVVMSKLFGLADPRSYGSKNPGATNVLRSGNKPAAALTLLLDAGKGLAAVVLVKQFGPHYGLYDGTVALVALAVFLGHLYPLFLGFKGGKGVATAIGIWFAIDLWLGLGALLTWIIIAVFLRYSSLAAMVAALFVPFYYVLLFGTDVLAAAMLVISGLILYRHRRNMSNLLQGKESRIGAKKH